MDNRLNYYTSITGNTITSVKGGVVGNSACGRLIAYSLGEPRFPTDRIKYYTSVKGGVIGEPWFHILENLKKLNAQLDENNIVLLAHMATNPYISEEDREKYEKRMKEKGQLEYEMYSKYINDIIRRDENRSTNESECNN